MAVSVTQVREVFGCPTRCRLTLLMDLDHVELEPATVGWLNMTTTDASAAWRVMCIHMYVSPSDGA